jgi:FG-GAP-like repeat
MNIKKLYILTCCLTISFLSVLVCKAVDFASPRQTSLPTLQTAIASGDLNNDGLPDLIVGGEPVEGQHGKIRVMLGKGNGNFLPFSEYRVGFSFNVEDLAPYVQNILVYDFNSDGNLDVVVSHNGSSTQFNRSSLHATVLMGNGQGGFQPDQSYTYPSSNLNHYITSMVLTDYNTDGLMDVVMCSFSGSQSGRIFGLTNLGNGNFEGGARIPFGTPIFQVKATFVNNDSNPDLVMATGSGIIILFGANGFFGSEIQQLDNNRLLLDLNVDDYNRDGKPDIIAFDADNPEYRVFLSSKTGYPANPTVYPILSNSLLSKSKDFNEDGNLDSINVMSNQQGFQIVYGNGNGTFSGSDVLETDLPISDFVFSDLDNNGKFDIAASIYSSQPNKQAAVFLQSPNQNRYFTDFSGDGKSDFTVFRPNTGTWWTQNSNNFNYRAVNFGLSSDKIVAGNYDGDNKADTAVFRNGIWYVLQSSDNSLKIDYWGLAGDIPVPADYDNDGEMEVAVYRPSESVWYIKDNNSYQAIKWGISTDKVVPADYDGDGSTDLAVYRPSEGNWYIRRSSDGQLSVRKFGNAEDKAVPADYDGDGKTDLAVYRPSESYWYILQSKSGTLRYEKFGLPTDLPVPSDFDGDNKTDIAVFRADEGNWYITGSRNNALIVNKWGTNGDLPISVDY